jgi:hypothetical protein
MRLPHRDRILNIRCSAGPEPFFASPMNVRIVFLGFLMTAVGCDPRVYLHMRESLRPTPSTDCMSSVLTASLDVAGVTALRDSDREGFLIFFRDSSAAGGQRQASLTRAAPPTTEIDLSFAWVGVRHPNEEEEKAVAVLAGRTLSQVRTACAPDSSGPVQCSYSDGRHAIACPSGA